jgi:hypothetical protein
LNQLALVIEIFKHPKRCKNRAKDSSYALFTDAALLLDAILLNVGNSGSIARLVFP